MHYCPRPVIVYRRYRTLHILSKTMSKTFLYAHKATSMERKNNELNWFSTAQ